MRRATAARLPERTFGLYASPFWLELFVELPVELLPVELLEAAEAEKLANLP